MNRGATRREILDKQGLLAAPTACQQAFWRRYNRGRRWKVGQLGAIAAQLVTDGALRRAARLTRLAQLWREVVPDRLERATRIKSYRGGRLVIAVDCAATKYVLERELEGALTGAMNAKIAGAGGPEVPRVRRIVFEVGCGRWESETTLKSVKGEKSVKSEKGVTH